METQKKQHCKSYKERDREKLFASFLHPTTIKAWNFKTQIIRASSWWKTQTLDRQTDRQTEEKLAYWVEWNWKLTTERKMVFLCSDDEFVAAICWFNDRSNSSSSRQTEEGERRDSWPQLPPILVLFSLSLSLSLSLSSPQKHKKNKRRKGK